MKNEIRVIGVPSDLGANIRGSNMGPAAFRVADLHHKLTQLGYKVSDFGDISVPIRNTISDNSEDQNFLKQIAEINSELKKQVTNSLNDNTIPLVLGGDHSLAIGSTAGVSDHYKDKNIGLIWIDTHADINTPFSSPSKNIHGMPIGTLLGNGYDELVNLFPKDCAIKAEHIALVGLRDIDPREKEILKESGVIYYTMRDIDELGIQKIIKQIHAKIIDQVDGIHVSFDLDVMAPHLVPGVSTPVPGGLTIREAHLCLEMLFETQKVVSADFVELNPYRDEKGRSAQIAVDLICSLFGKQVI